MKRLLVVAVVVAALLLGFGLGRYRLGNHVIDETAQEKKPSATESSLEIHFEHAGLEQIDIDDKEACHVWHTTRLFSLSEPTALPQSMASYDRHELRVWLTAEEETLVAEWMKKHKPFEFPSSYPNRPGPSTYGQSFESSLTIREGDRIHHIAWHGDSGVPQALVAAIEELRGFCMQLQEKRDKVR